MEQSVNISNEQWKSKRTADRHPNVQGGEFLILQCKIRKYYLKLRGQERSSFGNTNLNILFNISKNK